MKSQKHKECRVSSVECRGGEPGGTQLQLPPLFVRHTAPIAGRPSLTLGNGSRKTQRASQGVALVITLILLSVITFMAITFLVVSRGEKSTVGSVTEQTTSRLAAEQGIEMAQQAMLVQMLAFSNTVPSAGMLVSTSYNNPWGFDTALGASLTNVGYNYHLTGAPLNKFNDVCQNIANLFYLPRVPVYITNRLLGSNQFVDYLDLNRNGRFEPSGQVPQTNALGQPILTGTNTILTNYVMGDPQWIGILERGNHTPGLYNLQLGGPVFPVGMPHSADNLFISRYAYIVMPTSTTLDINYMHNYAKELANLMPLDGYWRNQGVGSWEINFAAFLADLNPNIWNTNAAPYIYNKNFAAYNGGVAFDDAAALLRYRYGRSWRNLPTVQQDFGVNGANVFRNDWIDGYTVGLMTGPWWTPPNDSDGPTRVNFSWSGSDNPSNFFDPQDLYDSSKTGIAATAPTFSDRLRLAGNSISSFDRYTFYRLLEQVSTDSAPESPKINLNYANVDTNTGAIVPNLATNFTPWQPVQFFTNAAARMLADAGYGTNIVEVVGGVARVHIQIYPTNYYTPSVHRYLQLAANIYDASTNRTLNIESNGFPSVFKPLFLDELSAPGGSNRVWIVGYREVANIDPTIVPIGNVPPVFYDLYDPNPPPTATRPMTPMPGDPKLSDRMVYGVPLVVGAKKGFPSFNEFGLLQDINVSRNLIFHRLGPQSFYTNQVYTMGISNVFSVEAWNSYGTTYPRLLQMIAIADVITAVTNEAGTCLGLNNLPLTNIYSVTTNIPIPASSWAGFQGANVAMPILRASFRFPLGAQSYRFLTNSDFTFNQNRFLPSGMIPTDPANYFPVPRWKVKLTARTRFALIDVAAKRIVDYVNLSEAREPLDVAQLLQGTDQGGDATCNGNFSEQMGSFFCTNRPNGSASPNVATYGILNQFGVSMGSLQVGDPFWRNYNPQEPDRGPSQDKFRNRILSSTDTTLEFAAPFVPRRIIHHSVSWQANDPLVHYVVGDLQDPLTGKRKISYATDGAGGIGNNDNPLIGFPTTGQAASSPLNQHYRPWGGRPGMPDSAPPTATRLELKDPLIKNSDSWSFMTNKFPNVGWLGRVHRGTPWQTVFLKSANIDFNTWTNWVGNNSMLMNYDDRGSSNYDSIFSIPTNDYRVLDMFTTAFNENASKGQLSVNQTNLAAWSAILSGVLVNTNGTTNGFTWIEPACVDQANGVNPARVQQIVDGINRARANTTNNPYGQFMGRGDILSVPELTMASPYIPTNSNPNQALPDWVYERIPQQVMGLLRGGDEPPRFVIYAFGQALKPAEHSLVTASGPFFGLCTNYQVTAESVIRAVVRVDNAPTPRAPNNIPRVYVESFNVLPPY